MVVVQHGRVRVFASPWLSGRRYCFHVCIVRRRRVDILGYVRSAQRLVASLPRGGAPRVPVH
eukprot:15361097-Alexandrium_andersonii.AAC.1